MEINGRFYHDPDIQLKEIKLAVSRMPADDPLQAHFGFLIGLIDLQEEELGDRQHTVEVALKEFGLEECDTPADDLEALIEFTRHVSRRSYYKDLVAATP